MIDPNSLSTKFLALRRRQKYCHCFKPTLHCLKSRWKLGYLTYHLASISKKMAGKKNVTQIFFTQWAGDLVDDSYAKTLILTFEKQKKTIPSMIGLSFYQEVLNFITEIRDFPPIISINIGTQLLFFSQFIQLVILSA